MRFPKYSFLSLSVIAKLTVLFIPTLVLLGHLGLHLVQCIVPPSTVIAETVQEPTAAISTKSMSIVQDSFTGVAYTAGKLEVSVVPVMKVGREYPITLRVSRTAMFMVLQQEKKRIEIFDVNLSPKVTADIFGEAFKIQLKEHSPRVQVVAPEGKYVEWEYSVMPLSTGNLPLTIRIGNIASDGSASYHQNEARVITVKASYTWYRAGLFKLKNHYHEYMWVYNIIGTLLSMFGISQYLQRKKK